MDGSDLRRWRDLAGPGELPNVIAELCRIVDGLHDLGRIHGDVSPGNVMVGPYGLVSQIDFTFMRFAELSRTTIALRGSARRRAARNPPWRPTPMRSARSSTTC
ncbi:hypothetical protein [Actinomadura viridis]|uniref:RIO-like serine/threonine protein kinase n=1 Tax=Actinomadura viridis TaxID=58110 RepID=A0A931DQT9_9ACTN|nr:hypothetical protein [Actinomadura viridis]MBG6092111.1 RIO-like serine/threonine protein kinase [Actinomadura viridis]